MSEHDDLVERALERLRRQHAAEPPDPALEAELRARFPRRRRRTRRLLIPGVTLAVLSGAAFAGGWQWLERWWFAVEVDGQRVEGVLEDDGARTFSFTTDDGGTATVRVRRETTPDGATRTGIDLVEEPGKPGKNGDLVRRERSEEVFGGAPPRLHAADRLDDRAPLFRSGSSSDPFAIFALSELGERPLLVVRYDSAPELLEELIRMPAGSFGDGAVLKITERAGGGLELLASGREGEEFAFEWSPSEPATLRSSELSTDDGRIRVRLEEEPPPARR